ncbi:hypothetical protein FIBSPDRAFT_939939 [Athelia psychrophila]|uniref:O-methyltransferase domain-containing protein n=1 Tax=Athelia psychrophila TaxID=1759441 RepID=A0A167WYZ1_9AGAM|nr:hypothetical protein FIBSPDRAFT_939939 [Fibularhizoctonia sp. CBS 109695]
MHLPTNQLECCVADQFGNQLALWGRVALHFEGPHVIPCTVAQSSEPGSRSPLALLRFTASAVALASHPPVQAQRIHRAHFPRIPPNDPHPCAPRCIWLECELNQLQPPFSVLLLQPRPTTSPHRSLIPPARMTFATLRALHALIAQAIDDIERVFAEHGRPLEFPSLEDPVYHPPAPAHQRQHHSAPPGEDAAERAGRDGAEDADGGADLAGGDREDRQRQDDAQARRQAAEALLATHPAVMAATNRIVAAAGHLAACVRDPFLSLCDASMGYHLPACMRFLEATHIVEVLREAGEASENGDGGMHVSALSARIGVPAGRLAHILRLLATHHILTERAPDVFANNRLSSRLDSGKRAAELLGCSPSCSCCSGCSPGCCSPGSPGSLAACACASSPEGKCPESAHPACENPPRAHGDELARSRTEKEKDPAAKYAGTNGVAAFVGLCTDELFKAAAYMAEAYVPALAPRPPAPAPSPPLSPSPSPSAAAAASPSAGAAAAAPAPEEVEVAPFGHAFGTRAGYFAWLEEGGRDPRLSPVLPFVPSPTSPASPASPSFSFSLAPSADSGLGWGADGADGRGGVQAQETRKGSVGSGVGVGRGADAEEGLRRRSRRRRPRGAGAGSGWSALGRR